MMAGFDKDGLQQGKSMHLQHAILIVDKHLSICQVSCKSLGNNRKEGHRNEKAATGSCVSDECLCWV